MSPDSDMDPIRDEGRLRWKEIVGRLRPVHGEWAMSEPEWWRAMPARGELPGWMAVEPADVKGTLEPPPRPWGDPARRTRVWRIVLVVALLGTVGFIWLGGAWSWPAWAVMVFVVADLALLAFVVWRLALATWERRLTPPRGSSNPKQAGDGSGSEREAAPGDR